MTVYQPGDPEWEAQSEHTSLPWAVDNQGGITKAGNEFDHIPIYSGSIEMAYMDDETAKANAAIIVTAVNERPNLLARIKRLEKALRDACTEIKDLRHDLNNNGGMYDDEEYTEGLAVLNETKGN